MYNSTGPVLSVSYARADVTEWFFSLCSVVTGLNELITFKAQRIVSL